MSRTVSNSSTKKYCLYCDNLIPKNSKRYTQKKFCNQRCGKHFHTYKKRQEKKIDERFNRLYSNDEWDYIVRVCKRSGTVQILTGHSVESLHKTILLIRKRPYADVELCHIAPVSHPKIIGKLHYLNLVYCGSYQNRLHSRNWSGGGKYILRRSLDKRWDVSRNLTKAKVISLIKEFLGEVLASYLDKYNIPLSRKEKSIRRALRCKQLNCELETLEELSYKEIDLLVSKAKGKHKFKKSERYSKYRVYLEELKRVSVECDGERSIDARRIFKTLLIGYFALYEHIYWSRTKSIYDFYGLELIKYRSIKMKNPNKWSLFKDELYNLAFSFLHCLAYDPKKGLTILRNYTTFESFKSLVVKPAKFS